MWPASLAQISYFKFHRNSIPALVCVSVPNCGWFVQINPQSADQYTIRWSIYKLWINPKVWINPQLWVNPQLWIIQQSINQSTIWGSIQNIWINPQYVNQSTILGSICGFIYDMLINPISVDILIITTMQFMDNSPIVDKQFPICG